MSSSANGAPSRDSSDKPERSRNAKAQARHRAKRKAYIEQLEQTVTKLQAALGYSPEQVSALPPSSVTIRELQQDINRLQKENEELRRMLSDRRGSAAPYDYRESYRKRPKPSHMVDSVYMDSHHHNERPPPLTIPPHYGNVSSNSNHHNGSLFSINNSGFQMPHTPSGSSATSSPPFSPTQLQASVHPIAQRPPLNGNLSNNYPHHSSQYGGSVKVEDDYAPSNHSISYSYSNGHDGGMDWHYSSDRSHLHR
ncbi:hypothetical protein FA15DRAFT_701134 [Coprinopsis marcescibilis]|uniref:BZIP domain-containing protein n=1 Tax=Coprinopsis marcescibilis TaxID=230819 RepID=A0A5C3L5E7_COPMA|nr:hypothetical protein FA15DRAFT_701134 [Coprinopsis marcescibilis]